MSSKVRIIRTAGGHDVFEITPTNLINVVNSGSLNLHEVRRSVTRKDVAKFFAKPVTGEYGIGRLPRIKTTYDQEYSAYLGYDKQYSTKFQIFIDDDKHFNIGCMEFDRAETAIIRRWAKAYVAKSSTKVVPKKSSRKAA
jgi:hypothetical protein